LTRIVAFESITLGGVMQAPGRPDKGDAAEAVARLRERPGKDLVILGSGELVNALMQANLIDEYILLIHPLVLGSGRWLFRDEGTIATLHLVDSRRPARVC
jgi:dihydrofolate reductase